MVEVRVGFFGQGPSQGRWVDQMVKGGKWHTGEFRGDWILRAVAERKRSDELSGSVH